MTTIEENYPPEPGDEELANSTLIADQAEFITRLAEQVSTLTDRVLRLERTVLDLSRNAESTDTPPN